MAIEVDDGNGNNNGKKAGDTSAAEKPQHKPQPKPAAATQNSGVQGAASQETQQTIKPQTTKQTQQGQRSMISARQNYGMSRAATSQAMRAIVEVIDKIAEGEQEQPVKFSFIGLDGEKEGLLISAVVVAAALKNPGSDEKYVAHHTLLLAQTARGATAVEQQFGQGIKYERLIVAADAYDATLRARVEESVKNQFPGFTLIDADATAVPADLDLRSEEAVRNVIANATTASSTLLASVIAQDGWVIDESVANLTFLNEIKASHAHFTDLTGQPVRSDVVVEMSVLTGRQQNQQQQGGEFQYNTSQAKELVTQTFGYIDLISTPSMASNSFGFGGMTAGLASKAEELKIYSPRLVITNLDTPDEACELPVVIQGLGTLQALVNDSKWIAALVQQHRNGAAHQEGGLNIRDLSAIGLEAPQQMPLGYVGGELPKPARLPLNNANVSDAMLGAAIQTYVHDDLLISMDVPECGASSWITSPFAAAARGDQNAIRDIFEAADLLTGGKFTPIYKAANKGLMPNPVYNDNMYVNLGFYLTPAGKRDIRDIDYLACLNATGDAELETINDWANLQANAEVDPMFRLTETRRIQQRLFESLTITGRAVRITFNPAFIYAVAAAVAEAGLVYETKIGMAAPAATARMVPAYMRNLPQNLGNAGAFVAGGMRRQGSTGFATSSFGRYARGQGGSTGAGNY
ncbi:hypothetical protein [Ralstonia phage RP12]|uniref:Uncharacterized protein n=1 Tax=Ralstonia phage RP12 TaxID=1923889 RepID=A0A1L7N1A3_9CAUD|nr:nuclear shell protein [Ralstonia phage RP12]BAW19262.1 hypothetical protein [Ralstonia phage RP12]